MQQNAYIFHNLFLVNRYCVYNTTEHENKSKKEPKSFYFELRIPLANFRLLYERDQLFKRIQEMLKNFDAELRVLRHEKFKMDIDLKNADLR